MKKQINCSGCKQHQEVPSYLIERLHKPISPYYSNSYSGIISIVCGVTLSFALTEMFNFFKKTGEDHFIYLWGYLLVIFIIVVIWHSYIKLIQYKGWSLDSFDTIIPIFFSINIYLLIFFIEDINLFSLLFSLCCALASQAFKRTVYRNKREAKSLYKIHYINCPDKIRDCIFDTIVIYEKKFLTFYKKISIIFLIFAMINIIFNKNRIVSGLDTYIIYFFMSAILLYSFLNDINTDLNKLNCLSIFFKKDKNELQ